MANLPCNCKGILNTFIYTRMINVHTKSFTDGLIENFRSLCFECSKYAPRSSVSLSAFPDPQCGSSSSNAVCWWLFHRCLVFYRCFGGLTVHCMSGVSHDVGGGRPWQSLTVCLEPVMVVVVEDPDTALPRHTRMEWSIFSFPRFNGIGFLSLGRGHQIYS